MAQQAIEGEAIMKSLMIKRIKHKGALSSYVLPSLLLSSVFLATPAALAADGHDGAHAVEAASPDKNADKNTEKLTDQKSAEPALTGLALEKEAARIHEDVIILDTHVDIPLNFATYEIDPGGFTPLQVDLPKMRAGGIDAAFFIVYTPQGPLSEQGLMRGRMIARTRLAAIQRMIGAYPKEIVLATTAKQVRRAVRSGRRAALIGMENAFPLGNDLSTLKWWRDQGVRYVGITHFGHNQFADSSNPNADIGEGEDKHGGLSPLGEELVRALNALGVMVDVSHAGKKTMMQAVALSAAPVIASHSGVKGVEDNARNLDDEQLKALAAKGGVVQVVAFDTYLKGLNAEQRAFQKKLAIELGVETRAKRLAAPKAVQAEFRERLKGRWEIAARAAISDFVDHIDHAVTVAGIDHVGIASDFDGGGGVTGWNDASQTREVTKELVKRGYSEEEIKKIWGGNLLRVMEAARDTAKELSKN